jgi:hypothetical protein
MINLVTLNAEDTKTVSGFITEMVQGECRPFPPVAGSYVVFLPGNDGRVIQVLPETVGLAKGDLTIQYVERAPVEGPRTTHISVETTRSADEVITAAKEFGWTARVSNRAAFSVIEVWYEDTHLIEFIDQDNQPKIRTFATAESFDRMFGVAE